MLIYYLSLSIAYVVIHARPSCAFATLSSRRASLISNYYSSALYGTLLSDDNTEQVLEEEVVDVAIIGAGIGGLCAGALLNTLYNKKVGIYESHYLAGGCGKAPFVVSLFILMYINFTHRFPCSTCLR